MSHLHREVYEGYDDDDPTDELAEVSERFQIQRSSCAVSSETGEIAAIIPR
jgi:hypothetical protein